VHGSRVQQISLTHYVHRVALCPDPRCESRSSNSLHFNGLAESHPMACRVQFSLRPPLQGKQGSAALTTAIDNAVPVPPPAADRPAQKSYGWLPLLTVLFLISYGLMTMLIVEQGRTIESQRTLIRDLFRDSTELSAVKRSQPEKNVAAQPQTQTAPATTGPDAQPSNQAPAKHAPSSQSPLSQTPSTQVPSAQVPSIQTPSAQVPLNQSMPQRRAQSQTTRQKQFQMPSRPASDLSDDRRAVITI